MQFLPPSEPRVVPCDYNQIDKKDKAAGINSEE